MVLRSETAAAIQSATEEELTKMLGAHVPASLYWKFKKAAADRNEEMKDAIRHAAMMYIDTFPIEGG